MLGNGYFQIEGKKYTPSAFKHSIQSFENVNQSEGGTELVQIVRLNKNVFTCTWNGIDDALLDELSAFCEKPTVTVAYRSQTYVCRARGFSPDLAPGGYKYKPSDGIWNNVNITFTQI